MAPTHEQPVKQTAQPVNNEMTTTSGGENTMAPPGLQLTANSPMNGGPENATAEPVQMSPDNNVNIQSGLLTSMGEGSDNHIHWPNTAASGVTLGRGYDIGSRSKEDVIATLLAAGMGQAQAEQIAEGAGLKGADAQAFVQANRDSIGVIGESVITNLLATMLEDYEAKAMDIATNTTAKKDSNGYYFNAAGREVQDNAPGEYVLTIEQWDSLHPAMREFLTDLIYQGGFYMYDRVARINDVLKDNDGDHLAQFRGIRDLFAGANSYMDQYSSRIGLGTIATATVTFNGETFTYTNKNNRNALRLAFLDQVITALEAGKTVTMVDGNESAENAAGESSTTATTDVTNADPEANVEVSEEVVETATETATGETQTYEVQAGESLWKLSQKFGVSIDALKAANPDQLKTWGSVQGFNAGATITIPAGGQRVETVPTEEVAAPTNAGTATNTPASGNETTTAAPPREVVEASTDYSGLAKTVFDAMNGWGTDENAVYTALATLQNDSAKISSFMSTYASIYGHSVVDDIKADFSNSYIFGNELDKALGYLNIGASEVTNPGGDRTAAEPVVEEGGESETVQPEVDYRTLEINDSVGAGGANNVRDVKIIQANLVHLGYLEASNPEIATVKALPDTDKFDGIPETNKAILNFQKFAMGIGGDSKVDAGGGTFNAMKGRLEMIQQYSDYTIETTGIDPVLTSSQWISQFPSDAAKNGDGRGLKESEKAYAGKNNNVCCWDAAQAMVLQKGGSLKHEVSSRLPTLFQQDGETSVLNKQAELGVKYIDDQLNNGMPVMIGVDDGRTAAYNADQTTEHFIVIMGKVVEDGKIYYRFFDPGTRWGAKGYSDTNLLYMGDDFSLSGKSYNKDSDKVYKMSQVRQNG